MPPYGLPRAGRLPNFSQIIRNTSGLRTPGLGVSPPTPTYSNPYGAPRTTGAAMATGGTTTAPDYKQLILSDPGYHQSVLNASAAGIQNEGTRSANTRSELVGFGDNSGILDALSHSSLDPNSALYKSIAGDVTQSQPFADQLTAAGLSTTAQMAHQHAQNLAELLGNLGARGAQHSGDAGIGFGDEAQRYSQAQYDARTTVLNYLAGVQAAYAQAQQGTQNTLADAASTAGKNVAALYPVTPGTTPAASGAPASTAPNAAQVGRNA